MTSHGARAGNLPPELTSFIGRRQDISEARELLARTRILTLTGPGGAGKTRLAVRTASKVSRSYPDGVWLVELAALGDGDRVARAVAAALGVPIDDESEPQTALEFHLRGRRTLLVLDTCEQRVEECARLADRLLRMAPRLQILTTSRQRLGVEGEHVLSVPPLSLPEPHGPSSPGTLMQSDAVRLFVERAAVVLPGFTLSDANCATVADICRRLDGLPLSVELAATRLRVLSVDRVLQRLRDPLELLTGGARFVPARQRTLRSTIDWSHRLCSPAERLLWVRMSVFVEGAELEAVEAVCSGEDIAPHDVLDLLAGLLDKSVLVKEETGGQVRFRMLRAIRQYGLECLDTLGEGAVLRRRHLAWCLALTERAEADWFGPDQRYWSGRLSREEADLRAAVAFGAQEPSLAPAALRIAAGAWHLRLVRGPLDEWRTWLGTALSAGAPEPGPERALALRADGWAALFAGDHPTAQRRLKECQDLTRQLDDEAVHAATLQFAGLSALFDGEFLHATAVLREALAGRRGAQDHGAVATTLLLLTLGYSLMDDSRATTCGRDLIKLCEEHQAHGSLSRALWSMGLTYCRQGQPQRAITLIKRALRTGSLTDHLCRAQCLEVMAWAEAELGHDERAAVLLGAAHTAWRITGTCIPGTGPFRPHHNDAEKRVRQALGRTAFQDAFKTGSRMTPDQAVRYAVKTRSRRDASHDLPPAPMSDLTPRQLQISRLVAQGASNKEIAARLVISPRTAEGHIQQILAKLGFRSRSQIASWSASQAHQ